MTLNGYDFLLNDCVVQERQIFLLKEVYGVRSRDIAELLKDEISEDYVNTKHSRLKKRMKQRLLALGYHGHQRAA